MAFPAYRQSDLHILCQTQLFAGLPEEALAPLLKRQGVSIATFRRGETIYSPTQFFHSLGVLLAGSATVEKRGGTNTMLMSVLHTGELFGAATLFADADAPYVVSIRAAASVRALLVEEAALLDMMRGDFRLAENYMRYLTGRIRFLNQRIEGFVRPSVEERLLLFLQNNAQDNVCKLPFGMTALAEALCVGRATLYRALDALEGEGRIRRDQRTIVLYPKEDIEP